MANRQAEARDVVSIEGAGAGYSLASSTRATFSTGI
jgi:hypothetical protein